MLIFSFFALTKITDKSVLLRRENRESSEIFFLPTNAKYDPITSQLACNIKLNWTCVVQCQAVTAEKHTVWKFIEDITDQLKLTPALLEQKKASHGERTIHCSYYHDHNPTRSLANNMHPGYTKPDRIPVIVNCGGKKKQINKQSKPINNQKPTVFWF